MACPRRSGIGVWHAALGATAPRVRVSGEQFSTGFCKEQRPRGLSARVQDRGLARGTGGHCSQGSESAGNTSPSAGEVRPSLWYVREVVLHVYGCGCSPLWGSLLGAGVLAGERGGPLGERASGVTRLSR